VGTVGTVTFFKKLFQYLSGQTERNQKYSRYSC